MFLYYQSRLLFIACYIVNINKKKKNSNSTREL